MTAAAISPSSQIALSLRTLYFARTVFSLVWVALVFVLAAGVTTATKPSVAAIVQLTVYPLWDLVATIFDIRARPTAATHLPQYLSVAIGAVATVGRGLPPQLPDACPDRVGSVGVAQRSRATLSGAPKTGLTTLAG